jgi:hypothetical protein
MDEKMMQVQAGSTCVSLCKTGLAYSFASCQQNAGITPINETLEAQAYC